MKTHLITTGEPLTAGKDLEALCGKTVTAAEFVFWFEDGPNAIKGLNTIMFCKGCVEMLLTEMTQQDTEQRYIYGVIPGEQALRLEDET